MSGRAGNGTVVIYGGSLISACTTGHDDSRCRHDPLRELRNTTAQMASMFGATHVGIEDGSCFLRQLPPQAVMAAINADTLAPQV